MSAQKTGFPAYRSKDGQTLVYATQIVSTEPFERPGIPGGAVRLHLAFGTVANMVPEWVQEYAPQAGGWFVVKDFDKSQSLCYYMTDAAFNAEFVKESQGG